MTRMSSAPDDNNNRSDRRSNSNDNNCNNNHSNYINNHSNKNIVINNKNNNCNNNRDGCPMCSYTIRLFLFFIFCLLQTGLRVLTVAESLQQTDSMAQSPPTELWEAQAPHQNCLGGFSPTPCTYHPMLLVQSTVHVEMSSEDMDAVKYLGSPADWREHEDQGKNAIIVPNPTQRVIKDGTVTGWNVYTTRGRRSSHCIVHLQIWRPVSVAEARYMWVGETSITALWVGHTFFALHPSDRFTVRRGDVLGIFHPMYNPFPWSAVGCGEGGVDEHYLFKNNPTRFVGGERFVTFESGSQDSRPCRRYSVNATIMDSDELELYDADYELTTDGRYDRRPYGKHLPQKDSLSSAKNLRTTTTTTTITNIITVIITYYVIVIINGVIND